jgi:hypothetical protein
VPPDDLTKLIRQRNFSETLAGKASPIISGLNQAYITYLENYIQLRDTGDCLKQDIKATPDRKQQKEEHLRQLTVNLHNYLSSLYSLYASVSESYKKLGVLGKYKTSQLWGYRRQTSIMQGLRTYVQHVRPINIRWLVGKSDESDKLTVELGVWLSDVADHDFYEKMTTSSGEKIDGVKYHYGSVDREFIDVLYESQDTTKKTRDFFQDSVENICDEVVDKVDEFTETESDIMYREGTSIPAQVSESLEI